MIVVFDCVIVWYCWNETIFPENLPEPCCFKKTVGDLSYTLVNSEDTSIASRYGCISNCVYHQDDLPGKLFCFADGDLPATCTGWCLPYPSTFPPSPTPKIKKNTRKMSWTKIYFWLKIFGANIFWTKFLWRTIVWTQKNILTK